MNLYFRRYKFFLNVVLNYISILILIYCKITYLTYLKLGQLATGHYQALTARRGTFTRLQRRVPACGFQAMLEAVFERPWQCTGQ